MLTINGLLKKFDNLIAMIMLYSIIFVSVMYSIFTSSFAELHIQLKFLEFPIFIGEILLSACLIFLIIRWITLYKGDQLHLTRWHYFSLLYVIWVLIKAFHGYVTYGPLAFRNAALFYYPWFLMIGFYLYPNIKFSETGKLICLLILMFLLIELVRSYYIWAYLALSVVIALHLENKWIKRIGISIFMCMTFLKFKYFFVGSRSHVVGMIVVFLFLVSFGIPILVNKFKTRTIILATFLITIVFVGGFLRFVDRVALTSMTTPRKVMTMFKELDKEIKQKEKNFDFEILTTKLFNQNRREFKTVWDESIDVKKYMSEKNKTQVDEFVSIQGINHQLSFAGQEATIAGKEAKYRSLGVAYSNILFRLFVWRDMAVEMLEEKAIFGINFGKPQRSKSLEIRGWARTEWKRDGWITPHNSFFHMIYRAGIFGVLFIVIFFYTVIKMALNFLRTRSITGGLLISILIYWIILSQFLVILEFPYIAIPFWCLFGFTLAYHQQLITFQTHENIARS